MNVQDLRNKEYVCGSILENGNLNKGELSADSLPHSARVPALLLNMTQPIRARVV